MNTRTLLPLITLVSTSMLFAGCGDDDTTDGGPLRSDAAMALSDAATGADAVRADAGATDAGYPGADASQPDSGPGLGLSARYPGDEGIGTDPSVLFHDDFESGWGRWDGPSSDTSFLTMQTGELAHAGSGYLRSTVTTADLQDDMYISSASRFTFERRVDTVFWRFYARFPNVAPNPHHWVRMAAGNESWNGSGLANTVPPGDEGFWFDFDISNDNVFNFYAYWHQMRSGRCNDGSATPGCAGDQGTTYLLRQRLRACGAVALPAG